MKTEITGDVLRMGLMIYYRSENKVTFTMEEHRICAVNKDNLAIEDTSGAFENISLEANTQAYRQVGAVHVWEGSGRESIYATLYTQDLNDERVFDTIKQAMIGFVCRPVYESTAAKLREAKYE